LPRLHLPWAWRAAHLEAFKEQVAGRTTRGAVAGGNNKMSEFVTIQMRVAEATASIDAAGLMIHRDIRDTLSIIESGKPADVNLRMRNRLTHSFRDKALVQAVDALFLAAGGLRWAAASGAAILARHPCCQLTYQPELGFGVRNVRAARLRA
jgi:hypothetical protein